MPRSTQESLLSAFLKHGQSDASVLPPALILHGPSASGKTHTLTRFLKETNFNHTLVHGEECASQRLLLQRCLRGFMRDLGLSPPEEIDTSCDTFQSFMVQLELFCTLVGYHHSHLLVLDRIDRCLEPPTELFAQFGRLHEQCRMNVCVVFVYLTPDPRSLLTSAFPHVYFPRYTLDEVVEILSATRSCLFPPSLGVSPLAALDFWAKYVKLVVDSMGAYTGADLALIRELLHRLWGPYTEPLSQGEFTINEFVLLYRHNQHLFGAFATSDDLTPLAADLTANQIPLHSKYLLVAAYLASYNEARYDSLLFSKLKNARADRRFGGRKTRTTAKGSARISNRMLAAAPFDLERLLAIVHAIYKENFDESNAISYDDEGLEVEPEASLASGRLPNSVDLESQIATLVSLRMLVKTGTGANGDLLGGKVRLRCNVSESFVTTLARAIDIDLEGYLPE